MMFPLEFNFVNWPDVWRRVAQTLNSNVTMRGTLAQRPIEGHGGLYVATDLPGVLYWDAPNWRRVSDDTVVA